MLAYLLAFATDLVPYLRGPSVPQWRWLHDFDPALNRLWPAALVLGLVLSFSVIVGRLRPESLSRCQEMGLLGALILIALCVQAAILFIERDNVPALLFDRVVSPTANGYFSVAVTVGDANEMLRDFPAQMKAFPYQHPSTHPPGLLLLYLAAIRLMEHLPALAEPLGMWARTFRCADVGLMALTNAQLAGAALLGLLTPVLSALTLLPLYGIGRRLYGVKGALRSGLLCAVIPAVSLFAAEPDQIYPLFACLALYWLMLAVADRRWGYALLAGLALSAATFMSVVNFMFVALPIIFLGLQIAFGKDREALSWRHLFLCAGAFLLGLASVWLVYQWAFGVSPFDILDAATHHLSLPPLPSQPTLLDRLDQIATRLREVNGGRDYWIWLFYNLYDFVAFMGLPLLALVVPSVVRAFQGLGERRLTAAQALPLAFALALLVLDVSGIIRGEVGRIWLFLMPIGALAAIGAVRDERPAAVLQLVQAAVFAMSLTVVDTMLWPMPAHERRFDPPPMQHTLNVEFDDTIRLLGYDLREPGEAFDLTLYWQSMTRTPVSYKVFVHLLDAGEQIRGQQDSLPVSGDWPTTCWFAGEVIVDSYAIPVAPDAPPGDYTLAVGLYQEAAMERLPVGGEDHVRLGPVTVPPSP